MKDKIKDYPDNRKDDHVQLEDIFEAYCRNLFPIFF